MSRNPPSGLLILTAVELEAASLARRLALPRLASFPFRVFGRGSLRLAPVGLGAAFLAERWAEVAGGLPDALVVSAGVCGGLDPRLRPGALVVPDSVLGPAGDRFELVDVPARATVLASAVCTGGRLVTTRDVAATVEEKAALRGRTGAVAVDMESAAILATARAAGHAAFVVRGVSDAADQSLPRELLRVMDADGRVRGRAVLALVLGGPRLIRRAVELGRSTRRALDAVAGALAVLARAA